MRMIRITVWILMVCLVSRAFSEYRGGSVLEDSEKSLYLFEKKTRSLSKVNEGEIVLSIVGDKDFPDFSTIRYKDGRCECRLSSLHERIDGFGEVATELVYLPLYPSSIGIAERNLECVYDFNDESWLALLKNGSQFCLEVEAVRETNSGKIVWVNNCILVKDLSFEEVSTILRKYLVVVFSILNGKQKIIVR